MSTNQAGLWLAFLAGLASFLSPCVLSLVPVYIGYLGGRAVGDQSLRSNRWFIFMHGVAFVVGFSLVFIFFNIIAGSLGLLLSDFQSWLARIGGLVVIIFGFHMTGIYRIPILDYEKKIHRSKIPQATLISSFTMGIFFSAGWMPCVGPILAWILTFSLNGGSIAWAASLGVAYSLGMAIPFLVAALGIGWVTMILRRYPRMMRTTEVVMGIIMILAGTLLFFDSFCLINRIFPWFRPIL
jgi:cytochrome c-type biogenesis protein